jgi:hypothetical protein
MVVPDSAYHPEIIKSSVFLRAGGISPGIHTPQSMEAYHEDSEDGYHCPLNTIMTGCHID